MNILNSSILSVLSVCMLSACTQSPTKSSTAAELSKQGDLAKVEMVKRDPNCQVNAEIERNPLPHTPNNMTLPSFGQGIIGWATGPEGAAKRLESVSALDIPKFKSEGVTLEMVQEWQAFYENEVKRNPCNPTAPYRAKLMEKIADLWGKSI